MSNMLVYLLFGGLFLGVQSSTIFIKNGCNETIWIGIYNYNHYFALSSSYHTANTGFKLVPNSVEPFNVTENWKGKIWPRTGCDASGSNCLTGDCGGLECKGATGTPPFTQAEIEFKFGIGTFDLSLVEGYNLAVKVSPEVNLHCMEERCEMFMEDVCPKSMRVMSNEKIIGCKNNCGTFKADVFCCRGDFEGEKCNPDLWSTNMVKLFKDECPTAYTYPYDQPKRSCIPKGEYITVEFYVKK